MGRHPSKVPYPVEDPGPMVPRLPRVYTPNGILIGSRVGNADWLSLYGGKFTLLVPVLRLPKSQGTGVVI